MRAIILDIFRVGGIGIILCIKIKDGTIRIGDICTTEDTKIKFQIKLIENLDHPTITYESSDHPCVRMIYIKPLNKLSKLKDFEVLDYIDSFNN